MAFLVVWDFRKPSEGYLIDLQGCGVRWDKFLDQQRLINPVYCGSFGGTIFWSNILALKCLSTWYMRYKVWLSNMQKRANGMIWLVWWWLSVNDVNYVKDMIVTGCDAM